MRRAAWLGVVLFGACVLPEFPTFEERFLTSDAGAGGGTGGGEADAGALPRCGETTPLTAQQLVEVAVRAASCGVAEGTATPAEWPRVLLDWARVLQRSPDRGAGVEVPRDACARLKCLASATTCAAVYACYGGAPWASGGCPTGERCDNGKAMHCDDARGPSWAEDCTAQGQACTVDTAGHATCGLTCPAASQGQCLSPPTTLSRCNLGAGRTYACEGRCVGGVGAGGEATAVCAPATGGACSGNGCEGDVAVDCPTRSFGDRLDCAQLPGGTCAQLGTTGPVFCTPKSGPTCAGSLGFFTSCDGATLVVCANLVETRVDCAALGFTTCQNGGPAGLCR